MLSEPKVFLKSKYFKLNSCLIVRKVVLRFPKLANVTLLQVDLYELIHLQNVRLIKKMMTAKTADSSTVPHLSHVTTLTLTNTIAIIA